jgi:dTDP-4-amino-4,6-dideoxygalactose transaminase
VDTRHALHLFTLLIDEQRCGINRDSFLQTMHRGRIGTGVHYMSVSEHPYYQQRFGWQPEQYPNAMRIGRQTASLPLSPHLTQEDVLRIIEQTQSALDPPSHSLIDSRVRP